jgi:predicted MFS family arabinose efflux permease
LRPIGGFGPVHVLLSLGQIAVLQGADRLEDALGSRSRLLFGLALAAALGWIGLGFFDSPWLVVPGVVVVASFGLARGPLLQASLHRHIPSERRATAISGVSMLRTLAIVVANSAAGLGAQAALGPTALAIGAAVLLLAFVARTPEQHL